MAPGAPSSGHAVARQTTFSEAKRLVRRRSSAQKRGFRLLYSVATGKCEVRCKGTTIRPRLSPVIIVRARADGVARWRVSVKALPRGGPVLALAGDLLRARPPHTVSPPPRLAARRNRSLHGRVFLRGLDRATRDARPPRISPNEQYWFCVIVVVVVVGSPIPVCRSASPTRLARGRRRRRAFHLLGRGDVARSITRRAPEISGTLGRQSIDGRARVAPCVCGSIYLPFCRDLREILSAIFRARESERAASTMPTASAP